MALRVEDTVCEAVEHGISPGHRQQDGATLSIALLS